MEIRVIPEEEYEFLKKWLNSSKEICFISQALMTEVIKNNSDLVPEHERTKL